MKISTKTKKFEWINHSMLCNSFMKFVHFGIFEDTVYFT